MIAGFFCSVPFTEHSVALLQASVFLTERMWSCHHSASPPPVRPRLLLPWLLCRLLLWNSNKKILKSLKLKLKESGKQGHMRCLPVLMGSITHTSRSPATWARFYFQPHIVHGWIELGMSQHNLGRYPGPPTGDKRLNNVMDNIVFNQTYANYSRRLNFPKPQSLSMSSSCGISSNHGLDSDKMGILKDSWIWRYGRVSI